MKLNEMLAFRPILQLIKLRRAGHSPIKWNECMNNTPVLDRGSVELTTLWTVVSSSTSYVWLIVAMEKLISNDNGDIIWHCLIRWLKNNPDFVWFYSFPCILWVSFTNRGRCFQIPSNATSNTGLCATNPIATNRTRGWNTARLAVYVEWGIIPNLRRNTYGCTSYQWP